MTQAINLVGGPRLLTGKVELIRFIRAGEVDRRVFSFNPNPPSASYQNRILMSGDIVNVRDSARFAGVGPLQEVATPLCRCLRPLLLWAGLKSAFV